ncbi:hypothetical protein ABZ470_17145 [Streptosporangium sp. NPDC020072]|uniref:hypothetical protein n=1 Tax=Streptosporangium sp. NPDC020072 TaxID=3154788 RepID=UPI003431D303
MPFSESGAAPGRRRGSLGGRGGRPRRGDRVGDLACERLDGSRTRSHAELRVVWAVLGNGAEDAFEWPGVGGF